MNKLLSIAILAVCLSVALCVDVGRAPKNVLAESISKTMQTIDSMPRLTPKHRPWDYAARQKTI